MNDTINKPHEQKNQLDYFNMLNFEMVFSFNELLMNIIWSDYDNIKVNLISICMIYCKK